MQTGAGKLPFGGCCPAGRAGGNFVTEDKLFKLMSALGALVFVNGHMSLLLHSNLSVKFLPLPGGGTTSPKRLGLVSYNGGKSFNAF